MKSRHFDDDSLVPISAPLGGPNPLEELNDEEFGRSLDEWRSLDTWFSRTSKNWCVMYLNEAERRWRPNDSA